MQIERIILNEHILADTTEWRVCEGMSTLDVT